MKFTKRIYNPTDIVEVCDLALKDTTETTVRGTRYKPKHTVYEIPAAFDLEASSFYCGDNKVGLCYAWTFGLNGYVIFGRSLEEYKEMILVMQAYLNLSIEKRVVVYVHNLAYDFQFIRMYHTIFDLFALDTHKPMYAVTHEGIEYRCSYLLTGSSLATVAKNLVEHKIKKLTGDLDYRLVRTPQTPMTDIEIGYCIEDVKIVMAAISEKIKQEGSITKIPATNTGYVRRYCKNACLNGKWGFKYKKLMDVLTMSVEEYSLCKDAFAGGFTHANFIEAGNTIRNVASYDETSAYPAVMVLEEFPMSKGRPVSITTKKQFNQYLDEYCLIFDVELTNIRSTQVTDRPLSISKCSVCHGAEVDNGRIIKADLVVTSLTNVDFKVYQHFYKWDKMRIGRAYAYKKARLPRPLVVAILDLYKKKTELKGIDDAEVEYMLSKGMLNSAYGMTVMDIVREMFEYGDNEWKDPEQVDPAEQIDAYNNSKNRFLFYPWGVFVTAYARRNVLSAVYACQHTNPNGEQVSDYIYSDTDSCKIKNHHLHKQFFDDYNANIMSKIKIASQVLNIPEDMFIPKTNKGTHKPIGVFDYEGEYLAFKTLGAKRYIYTTKDKDDSVKLHITVAGVNKQKGAEFLAKDGVDKAFDKFNDGLVFPKEYSGRLIHTYIDYKIQGTVIDYKGISYDFVSPSSVHMEESEYHMSLTQDYLNLMNCQFNQVMKRWSK